MNISIILILSFISLFALWVIAYCILCECHNSNRIWLREFAIRICYEKDRVSMTTLTRWYHIYVYRQAVIFYHNHPALYILKWNHR